MQGRERLVLRVLRKIGWTDLQEKKILELGCGEGFWLREFIKWGARPEQITGLDLLPERIARARELLPGTVTLLTGSAAAVPYDDETFDLVLQSTMFTSILDAGLKKQIAREMIRLTKPDGLILWYDYRVNNPRNPDVRGVGRAEISRLFPDCQIRLEPLTLAPPLCRMLAPYSFFACYLLEKLPFLCTHYLGVFRKK